MKKIVSAYLAILVVGFVLSLWLDRGGEYADERIVWNIQNDFQGMIHQPQSIPEGAISNIIGRYEKFIRKHPQSSLAPKAQLAIGNIYVILNDYPKAHEIFEQINKNYSYNAEVVAQAQFAIGKSYEHAGDWNKALVSYKKISKEYPLTSMGFGIPLYIGQYYKSLGYKTKALEAFDEAVEFYQNFAVNNIRKPLGFAALQMLVECHIAREDWPSAFNVAKRLMFEYPAAPIIFNVVGTIKNVCVEKMGDVDCAVDTYKEFMRINPGHPMNSLLTKIIKNIHQNVKTEPSVLSQ